MAFRWEDIEDAIQRVVVRSSGLDADKVTWEYQSLNEPNNDHVTLNFGAMRAIGIDIVRSDEDLFRPNGQEIGQSIKGIREMTLEIECFSSATNSETAAKYIAELIRTNLRLETNIIELRKVKVAIFDTQGTINWIPDIPSVRFRGRAILSVRCYLPAPAVIEYVGYISRVRGTAIVSALNGPSGATGSFNFDSNEAP